MAYWQTNFLDTDIMLPQDLLQILACPVCKGGLIENEEGSSLRCQPCSRDYPVVEGIPVLLSEQSVTTP